MVSYEEFAAFEEFRTQCPGYIVKAALGRIRGTRVELLETFGPNTRTESWLGTLISFTQSFSSFGPNGSAPEPWIDGEKYRIMAAESMGGSGYSLTLWSFEEPLQVVSVCSTDNGYIVLAFANGLQSRAPEFTTKAVQGLAVRLSSVIGNKGGALFGNGGKSMLRY